MILESSQDITVRGYDRLLRYLNTVLSFKDENEKGLHGGKISPESPRLKRKPKEEKPDDTPALVTLDLDWVFDVLLGMLKCEEIELEIAEMIVESAAEKFQREGLLVDLDFSESVEDIQTVVVGDIHGQFTDLLYIFEKFGRPCSTRRFIFNGDIVDRGPRSVACWLFLCALKLAVPDYLYVTRGNHESKTVSILFSSFAQECSTFYTTDFYSLCQRTFDDLPISYTLNNSIFITHGGLPKDLCLEKLRLQQKKPIDPNSLDKTVMALLWNDPSNMCGYGRNERGPNVYSFGPDITNKFLQKHKLSLLIRSHQHQHFGHSYMHSGKCLTIFSCPNYQYMGNSGAVALIDSRGNVKIEQFE